MLLNYYELFKSGVIVVVLYVFRNDLFVLINVYVIFILIKKEKR